MTTTIQMKQVPLHFRVVECKVKPQTPAGLKVFDMKVSFGKGKVASMTVEAESMRIALEILETLGQQYSKMDALAFHKYRQAHAKKQTNFRFVVKGDIHQDPKNVEDRIATFKPVRTRQGDIELAFGRKKGVSTHITLKQGSLEAIDRLNRKLGEKMDKDKLKKMPPSLPTGGLRARLKRKKTV